MLAMTEQLKQGMRRFETIVVGVRPRQNHAAKPATESLVLVETFFLVLERIVRMPFVDLPRVAT